MIEMVTSRVETLIYVIEMITFMVETVTPMIH